MPKPVTPQQLVDALAEMLHPDEPLPSSSVVFDQLRDVLHPIEPAPPRQYVVASEAGVTFESLHFKKGDSIGVGTIPDAPTSRQMKVATFTPHKAIGDAAALTKDRIAQRLLRGEIVAEPIDERSR